MLLFFYYAFNIAAFAIVGYLFITGNDATDYSLRRRFIQFSYGLAVALGVLPLHEYIHVLAYRSQGATNTSYDANLKKFYFMALADNFVASRKEFQIVVLAPFITITCTLVIVMLMVEQNWALTAASTLLAHTAMCSGDFGLLSFLDYHKDKDVVTYDNVENKTSYFYAAAKE